MLQDLDNVALAVAVLFGLMYARNPRYTFEVLQKLVMERNEDEHSNKGRALKNRVLY